MFSFFEFIFQPDETAESNQLKDMSGWTKVVTLSSSCSSPCVDPSSGSLIVATAQGDVVKIAKDGSAEIVARTQGQPLGVGFDAAGRMLICDAAHQTIFSLTDDGELSPIVSEYEEKAFRGPSSVAVDSAQTVYFTDSGHIGSTSLQNASGSVFAITGSSQVLQPLAFECLAHPCGVALAPPPPHDPTLAPVYVAEMMRNRVLRFVQSPKGVYHCSVFHQFAGGVGPSGVACDAAGHVFVARFEYHGAFLVCVNATLLAPCESCRVWHSLRFMMQCRGLFFVSRPFRPGLQWLCIRAGLGGKAAA